jgi:hypothetical protein
MKYEFKTPITYRLRFSTITGGYYHKTEYRSLLVASQWMLYYQNKYKSEKVVRLYAYQGDSELCDITVPVQRCLNSVN